MLGPVGGDETVLLVEDRREVRDLVSNTLGGVGYTVLRAADGEEALGVAQRHAGPIHLVLSDVVMPRMSGPEMAKLIREQRPDVRFLFMSGYPDRAASMISEFGERALIMKPVLPSDLSRRVREQLDAGDEH